MKEMNEPPKEYEAIKLLVEEKNNILTHVQNINSNKTVLKIIYTNENLIINLRNIKKSKLTIYKLWTI